MGQTTFNKKRQRLRARRITLICIVVLLLVALIVGAVWFKDSPFSPQSFANSVIFSKVLPPLSVL